MPYARIWTTLIDAARADEYEAFARDRSLPMFRALPGFRGAAFAGDGARRVVVTLWADAASAAAVDDAPDYRETVRAIVATGFLRPPQALDTVPWQPAREVEQTPGG